MGMGRRWRPLCIRKCSGEGRRGEERGREGRRGGQQIRTDSTLGCLHEYRSSDTAGLHGYRLAPGQATSKDRFPWCAHHSLGSNERHKITKSMECAGNQLITTVPESHQHLGRREWGGGNGEEGMGRREWRGGNGEEGMGRREWGGGNGEEGMGRREWGGGNGEEGMERREWGGGNGEEGMGRREWGGEDGKERMGKRGWEREDGEEGIGEGLGRRRESMAATYFWQDNGPEVIVLTERSKQSKVLEEK